MGFTSQLFHSKKPATQTTPQNRSNRSNQQATSVFTQGALNNLANMYYHNPAALAASDSNHTS